VSYDTTSLVTVYLYAFTNHKGEWLSFSYVMYFSLLLLLFIVIALYLHSRRFVIKAFYEKRQIFVLATMPSHDSPLLKLWGFKIGEYMIDEKLRKIVENWKGYTIEILCSMKLSSDEIYDFFRIVWLQLLWNTLGP